MVAKYALRACPAYAANSAQFLYLATLNPEDLWRFMAGDLRLIRRFLHHSIHSKVADGQLR